MLLVGLTALALRHQFQLHSPLKFKDLLTHFDLRQAHGNQAIGHGPHQRSVRGVRSLAMGFAKHPCRIHDVGTKVRSGKRNNLTRHGNPESMTTIGRPYRWAG